MGNHQEPTHSSKRAQHNRPPLAQLDSGPQDSESLAMSDTDQEHQLLSFIELGTDSKPANDNRPQRSPLRALVKSTPRRSANTQPINRVNTDALAIRLSTLHRQAHRAAHSTGEKARPSEGKDAGVLAESGEKISPQLEAELIAKYIPLVRQIAGGFQRKLPRNVLRDDLLAAGMSGLWDVVRKQVGTPSERFEYYVRVRVRGAILDELRAQDWLPRRARAAAAEAAENGNHARAYAPSVVRFDDVSEWDQGRCLSTGESQSSEKAIEEKFVREHLARAVDKLPARERHIVAAHYFRGVKFKDLGIELGVSEPRISQLHSRAMQRLRLLMEPAA